MLRQCGVRFLGFPLRLPVHREDLNEREAAKIIKGLVPPVFVVLRIFVLGVFAGVTVIPRSFFEPKYFWLDLRR